MISEFLTPWSGRKICIWVSNPPLTTSPSLSFICKISVILIVAVIRTEVFWGLQRTATSALALRKKPLHADSLTSRGDLTDSYTPKKGRSLLPGLPISPLASQQSKGEGSNYTEGLGSPCLTLGFSTPANPLPLGIADSTWLASRCSENVRMPFPWHLPTLGVSNPFGVCHRDGWKYFIVLICISLITHEVQHLSVLSIYILSSVAVDLYLLFTFLLHFWWVVFSLLISKNSLYRPDSNTIICQKYLKHHFIICCKYFFSAWSLVLLIYLWCFCYKEVLHFDIIKSQVFPGMASGFYFAQRKCSSPPLTSGLHSRQTQMQAQETFLCTSQLSNLLPLLWALTVSSCPLPRYDNWRFLENGVPTSPCPGSLLSWTPSHSGYCPLPGGCLPHLRW